MTTTLSTHPQDPDQLDLLALIADPHTPLGIDLALRFKAACLAEANANDDGLIHPCKVTARLKAADPEVNVRRVSALWASAEAPGGYLVKTSIPARLDGAVSKGNGGKQSVYRRWVSAS